MDKQDGGPAFPNKVDGLVRGNDSDGMSLRDWFAGQALASGECPISSSPRARALWALTQADAMIAERNKQH